MNQQQCYVLRRAQPISPFRLVTLFDRISQHSTGHYVGIVLKKNLLVGRSLFPTSSASSQMPYGSDHACHEQQQFSNLQGLSEPVFFDKMRMFANDCNPPLPDIFRHSKPVEHCSILWIEMLAKDIWSRKIYQVPVVNVQTVLKIKPAICSFAAGPAF